MKSFLVFFLTGLLFSACVKNNPDPSWIEVKEWTLESNPNATQIQGEMTHNITDACVFVDEKIIGIFEVPFKIPILKSGSVNIKIYPVIKNNGISATKKIYPFLQYYELNTVLEKNKTVTISPTTRYYNDTKFWIEDFEDATIKIENDPTSNVQILSGSESPILKYGNFYGRVTLNSTDSLWLAYTNGKLILPKGGKEVYLEIDYYNTNSVTTGLIVVTSNGASNNPNIQLNKQNPSEVKWKKIYIDLKELVSYSSNANYFEVSFKALYDAGISPSDIYLDNIKLVYN